MMRLQPGGDLLEMVHLRFLFSRMIRGRESVPPVAGSVAEMAGLVKVFQLPVNFRSVLSKFTVDFSRLKLYCNSISRPDTAERSLLCVTECLPSITVTHALLRASFAMQKRNRRPVRHKVLACWMQRGSVPRTGPFSFCRHTFCSSFRIRTQRRRLL